MFDALCDGLEGHFLGIRRGVELGPTLRRGNVFCYVYKRFFYFCHVFYVFLRFFKVLFERFLHLWRAVCPCVSSRRRFQTPALTAVDTDRPHRRRQQRSFA